MMTLTTITQSSMARSRLYQQLQALQSSRTPEPQPSPQVSDTLAQRLQQYGVSVHFSQAAQPYLYPGSQPVQMAQPTEPKWVAVFRKLGLIDAHS